MISIRLWQDSSFLSDLLMHSASSVEIYQLTHIDLTKASFINKCFKKELKIFKRIEKDYGLYAAYQISFIYKQNIKETNNKWFKPLVYPIFLYLTAWSLLCFLMWVMIPSIEKQMSNINVQFPSEFIFLLLGVQIGLIILLGLIRLSFNEKMIEPILKLRIFKHYLKLYLSYQFMISFSSFSKRGIQLIDILDINRFHPNKFLGYICLQSYKELKQGADFETAFKFFDSNLIQLLSVEKVEIDHNQIEHLKLLYESLLSRIFRFLKIVLQSLAYLMIAIAVLLSYQIVLLPLKMVEEFL